MYGYHKDFLRMWAANVDIQYISNPYCCIMYIVSYITKTERGINHQTTLKKIEVQSLRNERNIVCILCKHKVRAQGVVSPVVILWLDLDKIAIFCVFRIAPQKQISKV